MKNYTEIISTGCCLKITIPLAFVQIYSAMLYNAPSNLEARDAQIYGGLILPSLAFGRMFPVSLEASSLSGVIFSSFPRARLVSLLSTIHQAFLPIQSHTCCRAEFNATRHPRQMDTSANVLCKCICTSLLSWITHAHLVPLPYATRGTSSMS